MRDLMLWGLRGIVHLHLHHHHCHLILLVQGQTRVLAIQEGGKVSPVL